jgi:hypothetical protein
VALVSVSAIIVTRGDVDLSRVVSSIPWEWETLVWNNGEGADDPGLYRRMTENGLLARRVLGLSEYPDLSVYGRYAAIEHAQNDLIYVQDDDCIVSDPRSIVHAWLIAQRECRESSWDPQKLWQGTPNPGDLAAISKGEHVACNMPANFRHSFYQEHALVGFGAVFHRDAPKRAFERWADYHWTQDGSAPPDLHPHGEFFHRTCDIVFTALTPRVLVDVPYDDLPWASAENRMWKQPTHREERQRMLDLVKQVRDA